MWSRMKSAATFDSNQMSKPSPLSQAHGNESDSEEELPVTAQLDSMSVVEIDVESLNPLSPEVISKQATINIGKHDSSSSVSS